MSKNLKTAIAGLFFASFFTIMSCESGPKVIESEPAATGNAPHQHSMPSESPAASEEHKVVAEETLHTDKYTYVRVNENGQSSWIAIPKSNVEIGTTYYFKGGLMKKNFESKEFNRVFETLLLVSGISTQPVGSAAPAATVGGSAVDQALAGGQNVDVSPPTSEIKPVKGSVKISEIMGNLSKFDGKTIKVTGKVTKVNPMIMGRNWLHVQDGSANNFDLTVTTTENIQPGSVVTLEGVIALNKDFGAGYKYNVIMEGATVPK